MESLIPKKKRKLTECVGSCNICYDSFNSLISCFYGCTIKTCKKCLESQIKIKKVYLSPTPAIYSIYYKCSQCRKKVRYFPTIEDSRYRLSTREDVKFSKWVISSKRVLVHIINKFNAVDDVDEDEYDDDERDEHNDYFQDIGIFPPPIILPIISEIGSQIL